MCSNSISIRAVISSTSTSRSSRKDSLTYSKRGKMLSKKKEKNASKDEVLATLEKLKELKDKKVISNDEFEKAKAELLKKISE
jgi:predicted Zn-dependent peptidase